MPRQTNRFSVPVAPDRPLLPVRPVAPVDPLDPVKPLLPANHDSTGEGLVSNTSEEQG